MNVNSKNEICIYVYIYNHCTYIYIYACKSKCKHVKYAKYAYVFLMQCHWLSRLEVPGIVGFYLMWMESSTFSRDNSKTVATLPWCAMSTKSHPWKVTTGTAGTQEWRFGKSCLFSNWRLSSSMSYSSWSPTVETNRNRERVHAASRWWWTFALMQLRNRFNALQGKVTILYKHGFYP